MYGYIYKTTNLINGTIYIGQSHGDFYRYYLGSGITMLKAIKRYGRDAFVVEMLQPCSSQEEMDSAERSAIAQHRATGIRMYNIWDGGCGKPIGWKTSEETKQKQREAKLGRKHSRATRLKMSESQRKRNPTRSQESNMKRSASLKGRVITWGHKIALAHKLRKQQKNKDIQCAS